MPAPLAVVLAFQLVWPPWWGWIVALLVVILGGLVVTVASGPNMAAVGVTPSDRLLVRPVGLVRLWALSSGIDVPVTAILDVGVSERKGLLHGLKGAGTHAPGLVTAGTFGRRTEKDLWMVARAEKVLVIELHGEKYRRVIVQVEDPEAATEALRAAMFRER